MLENPKVSIIVPVYNVENYLKQCLDSILIQSYESWECILIDDGSLDNSGHICDEYANMDSRFRVIHKRNGGVSSARNIGLTNAKGQYVYFSDADDELLNSALEILVSGISSNDVDISQAGFVKISNDAIIEQPLSNLTYITDNESAIKQTFKSEHFSYQGYLWTKLFKLSLIRQFNIRFNENIYYDEDSLFVVEYLVATKSRMYITTTTIYNYHIRSTSAMSAINTTSNFKITTQFDAYIAKLNLVQQDSYYSNNLVLFIRIRCINNYINVFHLLNTTKIIRLNILLNMTIKLLKNVGCINLFSIAYQALYKSIK